MSEHWSSFRADVNSNRLVLSCGDLHKDMLEYENALVLSYNVLHSLRSSVYDEVRVLL